MAGQADIVTDVHYTCLLSMNIAHCQLTLTYAWGIGLVAFSSPAMIWGECSTSHTLPAFFGFYFLSGDKVAHTNIPLFRPGSVHSGSASWDDCGQVFLDELRVSLFPDRFPHYASTAAQSAHSDCAGSRVCACLGVICNLHFWQNDQGLLCATVATQGWNGHRIRVSTES